MRIQQIVVLSCKFASVLNSKFFYSNIFPLTFVIYWLTDLFCVYSINTNALKVIVNVVFLFTVIKYLQSCWHNATIIKLLTRFFAWKQLRVPKNASAVLSVYGWNKMTWANKLKSTYLSIIWRLLINHFMLDVSVILSNCCLCYMNKYNTHFTILYLRWQL